MRTETDYKKIDPSTLQRTEELDLRRGPFGLMPDWWIEHMAIKHDMIAPYEAGQVRATRLASAPVEGTWDTVPCSPSDRGANRIISYGTSSYGYDLRAARKFRVFTNINSTIVDPKNFDPKSFVDLEGDYCIIPPNSFALAYTVEKFKIPEDVLTICLGKSTYARCSLVVNVTPFEPGWEGHATMEISNTCPLPAKIYAGEGIAQLLFIRGEARCRTTYADRGGKYQNQGADIVSAKV